GWLLGRGGGAGALVAAVAEHAGTVRGAVASPAFGDAGQVERGCVVAGARGRGAGGGGGAGPGCGGPGVGPGHVFLAGEQTVVALAFTDRGDEPVHEHPFPLRALVLLLDLGAGDPP